MAYWGVDTESLPSIRIVLPAALFAAHKHAGQRRKGDAGEPYVNHLIEVASLVANAWPEPDANLVAAALLHDAIEDAGVTRDEIAGLFGEDVASLVSEVTDDKSLPKLERKRLQVEHAPHKSSRAGAIKLADKISNLRSILHSPPSGWDHERRKQYFEWAKKVVDGLAAPNQKLRAEFDATYSKFE